MGARSHPKVFIERKAHACMKGRRLRGNILCAPVTDDATNNEYSRNYCVLGEARGEYMVSRVVNMTAALRRNGLQLSGYSVIPRIKKYYCRIEYS